jgi:hypothetical protein
MKKFTLVATLTDNAINIETENTGFNALEILGLLEDKQADILTQMKSPSRFKRMRIDEDGDKFITVEEESK